MVPLESSLTTKSLKNDRLYTKFPMTGAESTFPRTNRDECFMTPQGPRIFTVNPQTFGAGRVALSQASPFKRLLLVLLLILVAVPLLALGMVILLIVFMVATVKALFPGTGRTSARPAGTQEHTGQTPARNRVRNVANHKDDSMRENVKVIER